jgi:Fe-S cluster assembly protein SufD
LSLKAAIAARDLAQLPSRRDEEWRWTDIRGLIRVLPDASQGYVGTVGDGPFDGLAERQVLVVNGQGAEAISVAAGETATVALRFVSIAAGAHAVAVTVDVAAGGRLTLLESYEGDEGAYVVQAGLSINLGEGAEIERIVLARDGALGVSVSEADVVLSPHASFSQTVVTDGARRQRLETRVAHPGGGAFARLDGIYLLDGQQHADLTTVLDHRGPDGRTDQLTKGVVRNQARAVFQGRIVVHAGADQTDARMGHHALILSDQAEVDAKPELQIWADDVSCSHGNTIGALDEEALFYARQRGMPLETARALLMEAFVGQVADRIGHDGAREVVRGFIASRLEV